MSYTAMPPVSTATGALDAGWLDVGHGHRVWYSQSGAADGIPVVLLHGGPGSASSPRQRDAFDAQRYRIVQFDQRGCGQSTPRGETLHNHTDALIGDIETLRSHLGIERWLVAGGSWGASLALAYAARHPERVAGLLLRGTFLTSREDIDWFFHGVAAFAPEAHVAFMREVPRSWQRSVVDWLDRRLSDAKDDHRARIAIAWQAYECRLDGVAVPDVSTDSDNAHRLIDKYRIQAHYLARRCFLGEAALLRAASTLRGIPVAIVHGTNDRICRPSNAWRVHRSCAGSRLAWAQGAGHDPWHPATFALYRSAVECFAERGDFSAWPVSA